MAFSATSLRAASLALLSGLLGLSSAACGGEAGAASNWAGTIDTVAGGRVQVSNPEQGAWKEGEGWTLVEEARIGSADAEGPELFGRVVDVAVDGAGKMWVADAQAQEIRVFAADGRHVRTVGRKGGGPGEFEQMGGLEVGPDGRLWVYDPGNMRFSVFDTAGTFVTSHRRDQGMFMMPWAGGFDRAGRFYDAGGFLVGNEFALALFLHDSAMAVSDTLRIPEHEGDVFTLESGTSRFRAAVPFSPRLTWRLARAGGAWVGFTDRYAFHHVTMDGDTTRTIQRQFSPVPVTGAERDEAMEGLEWFTRQGGKVDAGRIPGVKPAYVEIFEAADGHLWVKASRAEGQPPVYDLFDPEGRYLGRLSLPEGVADSDLFDVRGGLVYFSVEDEDEVQYVVRYRIGGAD